MSTGSLSGVKSFEPGGDLNTPTGLGVVTRTRDFFVDYAGTILAAGVNLGLSAYAIKSEGGAIKKGLAIAGASASAAMGLDFFNEEECARAYRLSTQHQQGKDN